MAEKLKTQITAGIVLLTIAVIVVAILFSLYWLGKKGGA